MAEEGKAASAKWAQGTKTRKRGAGQDEGGGRQQRGSAPASGGGGAGVDRAWSGRRAEEENEKGPQTRRDVWGREQRSQAGRAGITTVTRLPLLPSRPQCPG